MTAPKKKKKRKATTRELCEAMAKAMSELPPALEALLKELQELRDSLAKALLRNSEVASEARELQRRLTEANHRAWAEQEKLQREIADLKADKPRRLR